MTQKKGTVEKERVVCQNCRYHYSYLYDAKKPQPNGANTPANLKNYCYPRESFRACPHCGFYQDWMVKARRKHQMQDLILACLIGALGVVLYLIYQVATVALGPVGTDGFAHLRQAQVVLEGYLGLVAVVATLYLVYLRWIWNPNRGVDTQSYEAAVPQNVCADEALSAASQFKAAAQKLAEAELSRSQVYSPWASLSLTKRIFILIGVILGTGSLAAPACSPDLALTLAAQGMTMFPFYLGLVFLTGAVLTGSWQFIDQRLK